MDPYVSTSLLDLEHMIDNESAEPKAMSLSVLDEITNGFSEDHKIGEGGFAVVYKGILGNRKKVAVKKLSNKFIQDTEFRREVGNLMQLRHKNIVRFLGYCADTQGTMEMFNKRMVIADVQRQLLCFEYVPNGSLHDHITDASGGLEWRERYRIIKGVCEGLNYLHKNRIIHLDLKPANILMDDNMEPKIADFGLSRCFHEDQTHITTSKQMGTIGYCPPEIGSGKLTELYDIYSLGVIIIEMLTGERGHHEVEEVLDSWRNRSEDLEDAELEQIRVCAIIGDKCTERNPVNRPRSVQTIIELLKEMEGVDDSSSVDQMPSMLTKRGLLHVHQSQLQFPLFEPGKIIFSPLHLTNNTNDLVAFRCFPKLPDSFSNGISGIKGIVPPRSIRTFLVFMEKQPPEDLKTFDVTLESCVGHNNIVENPDDNFLPKMRKRLGGEVHQIPLVAVCHPAVGGSGTTSELKIKIICRNIRSNLASMDVHPTKPWILLSLYDGSVSIWNYETQARLADLVQDGDQVPRCCMFIAREDWIVVGDGNGDIHVRSCMTLELDEVNKFNAHTNWIQAMAVHPSLPFVLSGGHDWVIKLWNWEKNWECIRSFEGHQRWVEDLRFNPYDDNPDAVTFASATVYSTAYVWDISSPRPIATLHHNNALFSVDFLKCAEGQYVVTGALITDGRLWNLRTRKWERIIKGTYDPASGFKARVIDRQPDPPLLIVALHGSYVGLCDPTTLRYKKIIGFGLGVARNFVYVKGIRSVVIGFEGGVATLEID